MSKWSWLSRLFKPSVPTALTLLGLLAVAASVYAGWVSGFDPVTQGLIALSVLLVFMAWRGLSEEKGLLSQLDTVLDEAGRGQLEKRVLMVPEGHRLTRSALGLNDVLDQIEAVLRESLTVIARMGEGDFSREPQISGLRGIFPVVLTRIASVQSRVHHTVGTLREAMTAMAQGNFEYAVDNASAVGEYRRILDNAQQAIVSLDGILGDVVKVMAGMSQGDLTARVHADGRGSLARLKSDINQTLDVLAASMGSIGGNARQVATASAETSNAISQISDGVQNQTIAIDQVSTAVRQTAAAVAEVSRSTDSASSRARQSVESVRISLRKMDEMVHIVNNIAANSEKINKITEVIEKIANKTNLLSLNAAIEAARAGEHGKGFAVVADEVGKLALSSAESSKEIASLVEKAVIEARQAVKAVTDVSAEMTQIDQAAVETDSMLQRVASAMEEQSAAVEQINSNLTSVNQIARSNAAASEEITATVMELSKIANATRQEVDKFHY
jgi:methyl-accepting chemotaxis protein